MMVRLGLRMLRETDLRLLAKFSYTFGWKGMRAVQKFKRRVSRGEMFPAFLFVSVTNACNLTCQGCWVSSSNPPQHLPPSEMDRIIAAGKRQGSFFYGLLGGEPLLHPQLFDMIGNHPDCYFQVFTNGTTVTREVAREMRRLGNVTPLISVEGSESVSDVRRGGSDVFARTLEGIEHCTAEGLVTGVACSVCQSNIDDLVTESFAKRLIDLGVHYLWYYVYRPVGPRPTPELALDRDQVLALRQFMVDLRCRVPLAVVDAYWDDQGKALCPAAVGISHHINPYGEVEPCPIVQFAADNITESDDIVRTLTDSAFLSEFRDLACRENGGCILVQSPETLADFVTAQHARDSSGRGVGTGELTGKGPRQSHSTPGDEIPERHWAYRFAKKHWFFGFGAYG